MRKPKGYLGKYCYQNAAHIQQYAERNAGYGQAPHRLASQTLENIDIHSYRGMHAAQFDCDHEEYAKPYRIETKVQHNRKRQGQCRNENGYPLQKQSQKNVESPEQSKEFIR